MMTQKDAAMFPIIASAALFGLYIFFQVILNQIYEKYNCNLFDFSYRYFQKNTSISYWLATFFSWESWPLLTWWAQWFQSWYQPLYQTSHSTCCLSKEKAHLLKISSITSSLPMILLLWGSVLVLEFGTCWKRYFISLLEILLLFLLTFVW